MTWQPIFTAPRDATSIIVIAGETIPDSPDVRVACYLNQEEAAEIGYPAGWLIWNSADDYFVLSDGEVTHWMPLPPVRHPTLSRHALQERGDGMQTTEQV